VEKTYADVLQTLKGKPVPKRPVAAPNRLETRTKDLLASLPQAFSSNSLFKLREQLQKLTGREHIFFAPSCRAAIASILSLLPAKEVVMPAYTCPVVKKAVQIAKKNPVYVDVAENGINSTSKEFIKQIKPGRVLIPTHIFGIPTDIEAICDLARANNCLTIEDAAASFGSIRNGRMLGTFGDVGVLSFERSKRLPAFRGAAIIINNEKLFNLDATKFSIFEGFGFENKMPIREIAFSIFYNVATSPWIYGTLALPLILNKYRRYKPNAALDDNETEKNSSFYTRNFHQYQAALILRMLKRLDQIRAKIADLVTTYKEIFKETNIVTFVPPDADEAGLLRFPIAFPDRERRDILRRALSRGLFLETNYTEPLPDRTEWDNFPQAKRAAQNIILLPLYSRLQKERAIKIAKTLATL
jgi:dTDP-4-amino-4,6-dideoxygalactose transaminase